MDALTYFFVNYGFYSLLLVVPAALLGAAYGWIAWGRYRAGAEESRRRMEDAERIAQKVEIALSKEREQFKLYRDAAEKGGTAPVVSPEVGREMAALRRENEELEKILGVARKEREVAEGTLAGLLEEKGKLAEEFVSLQKMKADLEKKLAAKSKDQPKGQAKAGKGKALPLGVPKTELKKFKSEKRELEKKLANQERDLQKKLTHQQKTASKAKHELEKKLSELDRKLQGKTTEASELRSAKEKLETELSELQSERVSVGKELAQVQSVRVCVEKRSGRNQEGARRETGRARRLAEGAQRTCGEVEVGSEESDRRERQDWKGTARGREFAGGGGGTAGEC